MSDETNELATGFCDKVSPIFTPGRLLTVCAIDAAE